MQGRKFLVISVAVLAISALIGMGIFGSLRWPDPVQMDTSRLPSIGNRSAPLEIVMMEDFFCSHCKLFSQIVFPKVETEYIETGKARYVLVLVALSSSSRPLANAALAVYHQAPASFLPYVEALFDRVGQGTIDEEALLDVAKAVGGINLDLLEKSIEENRYYEELDRNLQWGKGVMGKKFGTPALYINGVATPASSFPKIQERADYFLSRKQT